MLAVLVIAAPVLQAPDDPGIRGLWGLVALVLLLALVAAHVRVLRAVARQIDGVTAAPHPAAPQPPDPQPVDARPADPAR